eukprot:6309025-Prymnesium_polylepis.1
MLAPEVQSPGDTLYLLKIALYLRCLRTVSGTVFLEWRCDAKGSLYLCVSAHCCISAVSAVS